MQALYLVKSIFPKSYFVILSLTLLPLKTDIVYHSLSLSEICLEITKRIPILLSTSFFSSFFRLSYSDQSTLLNSNMKKYLQYAKAYVISQHFTYDEEYFNSIDIEAQFIGLSDGSFQSISFMLRNRVDC